MKVAILFFVALLGLTYSWPMLEGKLIKDDHSWIAPGKSDVRSPCPVLNTLANHGYLPRNGKNITKDNFVSALEQGISIGFDIANLLGYGAFKKFGNPATLDLSDLQKHNAIEHDSSLTRQDNYFGQSTTPLPSLLKRFLNSSSDGKYISFQDFITYRRERQAESKAKNPTWLFESEQQNAAAGEAAAVAIAFGDVLHGLPVENAKSVFQHERFPSGWTRRTLPIFAVEVLPRTKQIQWGMMKP
eukprot:TRINITY_DN15231_c0_g1_i1.p1 TRINITY_DN15231_c0_g1~~TRINITY_DN15231_c0_g1_i1.p1  ORF type:complete len:244 (-),score=66.01 TRINITY_DN15231_c0_g1_i1:103-834(-)